jgi:hypothetical protein
MTSGKVVGALIVVIIVIIALWQGPNIMAMFSTGKSSSTVNMSKLLQDEMPGSYSISNTDWLVWSKTFRDSGGILTKMDTWTQFKEAYRQSIPPIVVMLDEGNHVVWFKSAMNQAIYYQY